MKDATDTEKKVNMYIRNIPESTKMEFKSYCALHGTNMNKELLAFMLSVLGKHKENKGKL